MAAYFHEDIDLCFAAAYDSDERQVQQIDSLVDAGIDLLIVAPNQVETISPAIDRAYDKGIPVIVFERKTSSRKYTAFISAPGIETVATLQGDWTEESAVSAVKEYKGDLSNVDFVFGQNDRMAMGARRAIEAQTSHPSLREGHGVGSYCGIDGLTGKGGGIELVRDSLLEATYIYPTRGDQIIKLALNILKGQPYAKENMLSSALVTFMLFYLYHRGKITLRRQRVVNTLWNMPQPSSFFISRFREVVEARLSDSDLSVEDLAADMNLSRVQLSAPSYFTKCFKDEYSV